LRSVPAGDQKEKHAMEQESTKRQSTGAVTATATGGGRIVGERYQLGRLLGEGEYSKYAPFMIYLNIIYYEL
jgi:sorbitol-specific phosphotransferase system component IIBC